MTTSTLNRLTPTQHAIVRILKSLELNGPADWRTLRDVAVGDPHRAVTSTAIRTLLNDGHITSRVLPNRKYHRIVFERGTGTPEWFDSELFEVSRGGWRRRRLATIRSPK